MIKVFFIGKSLKSLWKLIIALKYDTMLKMMEINKKYKATRLKFFLIATLFSAAFTINPAHAAADGFTKDHFALKFNFPDNAVLTSVSEGDNVVKYVQEQDATSVFISSADIYYTVTNDGDKTLEKRYPKKDLWLGCGLFNETWNDKDYVLDYLSRAVSGNSINYNCSIENTSLAGMPFYKFTYRQDENNDQMPGGVIYLTLYQSDLYSVQFFNYKYAFIAPYSSSFENTLNIDGIDQYRFRRFGSYKYVIMIAAAAAAAGGLLVYQFRNGKRRGN